MSGCNEMGGRLVKVDYEYESGLLCTEESFIWSESSDWYSLMGMVTGLELSSQQ